jgi:hypothetical protein
MNLTATPAFLQQTNQYHSQFGVAISAKYHGSCETELLFLDHLGDETACVNPSSAPPQNQGFLECGRPLVASEQECCSWFTEPRSAVYRQIPSQMSRLHLLEALNHFA